MKKLYNISAALAIMLMARGLASCSSNAEPEPAPEKTVEVTFKAQLPSRIDARAIADGTKANELFFYVYDENNNNIAALNRHNVAFDPTGEASVTVALTAGHTYSFAFWAQAKGVTVYDPSSASTVSLDYGSERKPVAGNDDLRDAFYSLEKNVTVAADGTTHYTYVNPTRNPVDFMLDDCDSVTGAQVIDVHQLGEQVCGTSCGFGAFALAGANYVMLSSSPNWNDGFVVARLGATATGEIDGSTVTVVARHDNAFTGRTTRLNWLNAEPRDSASVYIYQWNPGGYIARYTLAPEASAVAPVAPVAPAGSVTYVTPAGLVSPTPVPGVNIEVTRYTDGTCQRVKMLAR